MVRKALLALGLNVVASLSLAFGHGGGVPCSPPCSSGYTNAVYALSPAGMWPLEEASGTTAFDLSGNSRNGTYVNAPTMGQSPLVTGSGSSVLFTAASSQYVTVSNASGVFSPGTAFSFIVWIKTTQSNVSVWGVANGSGTDAYGGFINGGSGDWFACTHNSVNDVADAGTDGINNGTRHFACYTWKSGGNLKLYLDSVQTGVLAQTVALGANTFPLEIGRYNNNFGGPAYLFGTLSQAAFFTKELTQANITALWNLGK